MLKKPFPGLFQPRKRKTRFPASFIFNGLQPLKMAAPPCAAHRLSKNYVFQQPANSTLSDYPSTGAGEEEGYQTNGLLGFVTTPP